jgi:stearoyl-CoA desaturase (delta-9 desaturase)
VPAGVVIGLCSAIFTALVTEVYCHRCLAHRAFRIHARLAAALGTYFRVIVGTDPETWAAVHRLHHRYADTPLDPHSPVLRPPLAVLLGSPFLFAKARHRVPPGSPRGRGDLVLRAAVVAFFLALFGPVQVLVMLVVHLVCYMGIMGLVNTVGHLYGRKPHADVPGYDIGLLAIPLLGHGYHNSHHAHPSAARTGPLDSVWPLLRLMAAVGLVDLDDRRAQAELASPVCCDAAVS